MHDDWPGLANVAHQRMAQLARAQPTGPFLVSEPSSSCLAASLVASEPGRLRLPLLSFFLLLLSFFSFFYFF
jgi:hypothetical protein